MPPPDVPDTSIAICAIFKNEGPYLLEWIGYHKLLGVERFYLYDNRSEDGGSELVRGSKYAHCVTINDWPQRPGQLPAYADCIQRFARSVDWLAFIDLDEFLHPLKSNSLHQVLCQPRLDKFSALLPAWLMFGTSGFRSRPDGLVLENYKRRSPLNAQGNRHIKTIVRGDRVLGVGHTPHTFVVRGECCTPAGDRAPNVPLQDNPDHSDLVINHYFTKSEEDWSAKRARGRATTTENQYAQGLSGIVDAEAQVVDTRIQRFIPRLRWELR